MTTTNSKQRHGGGEGKATLARREERRSGDTGQPNTENVEKRDGDAEMRRSGDKQARLVEEETACHSIEA